jgi:hypothetical protein
MPTRNKNNKSKKNKSIDFFSFELTRNTFYWSIFLIIAIIFTIWVSHLELQIQSVLDQVTEINSNITAIKKK